jgi:SAM-dependent methyltransferase
MQNIDKVIQENYTKALNRSKQSSSNSCCSPTTGTEITLSSLEGESLPTDQNISFGCYRLDPVLENNLTKGSTVIDFGSGPGHDLFLAARIIGSSGRAIGVDFTDAMIEEATQLAKEKGLNHVELVKASIDNIPLEDKISDFIISNCVVNLAVNKQAVFNEAFRLLKPGGMFIDADMISGNELSENMQKNDDLWCSCISGAVTANQTLYMLKNAGFKDIDISYAQKEEILYEDTKHEIFSAIIIAKKPLE